MIDRIVSFLRSWLRLVRAVEALLIDSVAATAPWLAPLIPAFMTWDSMVNRLNFPPWVALVGAGVVESLGLSAVTTAFQLWDYNDSKRIGAQRAPVLVAILTAAFYLAVVLTVNVLLDVSDPVHRLAKALLSSLSILAAVILAIRAQHARRLEALLEERDARRAERAARRLESSGKITVSTGKLPEGSESGNFPEVSGVSADWRNLPPEDRQLIANLSTAEIVRAYSVSDRTARNWRASARLNGNNLRKDIENV